MLQAQACFSLGNSCTLLRDYSAAVVYYLRHLHAAWEAGDRVGEGRGHWSLANVYAALGDYQRALRSSLRHRKISKEVGVCLNATVSPRSTSSFLCLRLAQRRDRPVGSRPDGASSHTSTHNLQAAAEARALEQVLLFDADNAAQHQALTVTGHTTPPPAVAAAATTTQPADEDASVEELSERELDAELSIATSAALQVRRQFNSGSEEGGSGAELLSLGEDNDFIVVSTGDGEEHPSDGECRSPSSSQSGETSHQQGSQSNHTADPTNSADSSELLFDLLFKSQAHRMNDQRCDLNAVATNSNNDNGNNAAAASGDSVNGENDSFADLLISLQHICACDGDEPFSQGARMNDQRADFPGLIRTNPTSSPTTRHPPTSAATTTTSSSTAVRSPRTNRVGENAGSSSNNNAIGPVSRIRSASDGLAEPAPPSAGKSTRRVVFLAAVLRVLDFLSRLFKQKTRINDQRTLLAPPRPQMHCNRDGDSQSDTNSVPTQTNASSGRHTPHRLLRVLSVPGGKRRRGAGGGNSSKAAA
uniref:TPR_REGION domain-containing protein n=1 Tax=Mesocestoides corti TaxID=53468 RepID=A0A5K3F2H5_MESCO